MRDSIRTALTWGVGAVLLGLVVLAILYRTVGFQDESVTDGRIASVPQPETLALPRWPTPGEGTPVCVYVQADRSGQSKTNALRSATPVGTNTVSPVRRAQSGPAVVPGEYVLSFYTAAERDRFADMASARGAKVMDRLSLGNSLRLKVGDRALLDDLIREGPAPVEQAPNYRVARPPDPPPQAIVADGGVGFGGQVSQWLGLPADRRSWGDGIKVAIVDAGVGHAPSLAQVQVERVDLTGNPATAEPVDSHGTAVASLVAGRGSVAGIAPGVSLLDIRVMSPDGTGDSFTLARGIVEAVDRGAAVINVSLGSQGDNFLVRQAVAYAAQKGAVVVASVGNDGSNEVLYPAAYEGAVAVAAVDARERTPGFSNRGPQVDLAAPGLGISAAGPNGTTQYFSGTSAAAPLVSGAIAAMLSMDTSLKPADAAELLRRYADDTGTPGPDTASGAGIVDPMRVIMRNQPGIRDIAVLVPAVVSRPGSTEGLSAVASAQNRGTEVLPSVELTVSVDGVTERRMFSDVAPGATVSHTVTIDSERFRQTGEASVTVTATTPGVLDAVQANNTRTTVVRARQPAK